MDSCHIAIVEFVSSIRRTVELRKMVDIHYPIINLILRLMVPVLEPPFEVTVMVPL
jgi:hypothetical protein